MTLQDRITQIIKEQGAEVDRLQHVAAIDLPAAQRRLKQLKDLRDQVIADKTVADLLKSLCDEQIVSVK